MQLLDHGFSTLVACLTYVGQQLLQTRVRYVEAVPEYIGVAAKMVVGSPFTVASHPG